ncbi:MAG: uracil-DNA glycosylase [Betaproteobacteria bacterium]
MNLPYDENYLREMELWPFFESQQRRGDVPIVSVLAEPGKRAQTPATAPRTHVVEAPYQQGTPAAAASRREPGVRPPPTQVHTPPASMPADPARLARIAQLDWEGLKADVASCTACVLCKQRKQAVLGVGAIDAPWLFLGEGPGAEEDEVGEPFVGPAGKLLDAMLAATGLQRGREVYIVNTVKCRPPGNRNPSAEEVEACAPYLERQIDLIKPKLIVALGKIAATRVTGAESSMAALRGQLYTYRSIPVVATYHPAYYLRTPPDKVKGWEDLMLARKTMAGL